MTRDGSRSSQSAHRDAGRDFDLIESLWEEAPFARLPHDAPAALEDLVQDIENPKRVYAIHQASRRYNFQLLVERYVAQLRYGCDCEACVTPTCFSCRKRLAGKAPIRRFTPTSARTLATFLASQDSPENGLCPYFKPSRGPPASINTLIFSSVPPKETFTHSRSTSARRDAPRRKLSSVSGAGAGPDAELPARPRTPSASYSDRPQSRSSQRHKPHFNSNTGEAHPSVKVTERPTSKDHRSFAANIFGSVAFKMLEWLTPTALAAMAQKIDSLETEDSASYTSAESLADALTPATESPSVPSVQPEQSPTSAHPESENSLESQEDGGSSEVCAEPEPVAPVAPTKPSQRPNNRVRATSTTTAKRRISLEPIPPTLASQETSPAITSPRLSGGRTDKIPRPPKTATAKPPSSVDSSPEASFFEDTPPQVNGLHGAEEPKPRVPEHEHHNAPPTVKEDDPIKVGTDKKDAVPTPPASREQKESPASEQDLLEGMLPQSLSKLNIELVDLICDILQDDGTSEKHMFEPPHVSDAVVGLTARMHSLQRSKATHTTYPTRLKKQWRLFIQQSLFNILSDPEKLIASFVKDGNLLDSHSLWYCMLRLTRVAPSLVFDSLWIAAGSLFGAPKSLQALRSPTTKVFRKPEKPLTNLEAGQLMAICLHALIAAAPLVTDTRTLWDMSKLRSNGFTLATGGSIVRQPAWLCLQYEDAFSDDLVLRLAKRVFSAISARQCFAEMASLDDATEQADQDVGGLRPLLSQLDLLSIETAPSLEFSATERAAHESRASILLLDWAKTVLLHQWDGQPEISCSGSFGGALALIRAMYERRQSLLLSEAQFRVEYFADRLDYLNMPVAWLSHESSKQKKHLLDLPFIFHPSTLVSYFRSINFLRMSRSYEESNSLQNRMKAIMTPGGLITEPHHRRVLQDELTTASSKFLVLEISRKHVIRDAFDQLWHRQERELLRPLKVHLGEEGGEEGFDLGGVQQEFFRLAVAECLNPDFGAFTVDSRTRMAWFVPGSLVPTWKFEMFGLLVSLAIYNGVTLPVTFPKALYRKLLNEPVDELHHIADGWPDLASGLTTLLEWDETNGPVEDIFVRTYEFSVSMFGQPISREMNMDNPSWPQLATPGNAPPHADNPDDAPLVTNENRNAYVSDYIRYLTDVSVRPQYEAFSRGFRACLHAKSLSLLSPNVLQKLVEGQQEIDISEMRRYARYVGWEANHRTVRDFWSIVKRYDEPMKRKLLEFITASDRVPVGGMQNLQFVLQKNGVEREGGHLPTAYTCYGTLLLPEYKDREVLRERLAMALENSQGFGFG